mgnify:CR=1 FL=1
MQKNYPGRLYKFFGIETTLLIRGVMAIAHQFVDDFTKQKMSWLGSDYKNELIKVIPEGNLQQKYGGTAEDVK